MLIDYQKVNIYQQDRLILKNVNFHADEGEFIYIIGKVGSGKSSLLKTCLLYTSPSPRDGLLSRMPSSA